MIWDEVTNISLPYLGLPLSSGPSLCPFQLESLI
jgi:hypothetical protein